MIKHVSYKNMLGKLLFTTVPGSIFLASLIISTSILIAGGNLKTKDSVDQNTAVVSAKEPLTEKENNELPSQIPQQQAAQLETQAIDITNSPVLGDKNAKLTLVEFSDFECPFCKKAFDELLPQFKTNYIDSGKVKLVYKNLPLPFHQNAAKEAEAALCARDQGGDSAYYKYHDQIFTRTKGGGTGLALADLSIIAEDLGLKVTAFQNCLDQDKFKTQVEDDLLLAKKAGVNGTPTWFIGKTNPSGIIEGEKIIGAQPFSTFSKVFDQKLSEI